MENAFVGACGCTIVATQYGEMQEVRCPNGYMMQCDCSAYPEDLCATCERMQYETGRYF